MKLEDEKITRARYIFLKKLIKLAEEYREKGVGINSVEIEWEDDKRV